MSGRSLTDADLDAITAAVARTLRPREPIGRSAIRVAVEVALRAVEHPDWSANKLADVRGRRSWALEAARVAKALLQASETREGSTVT
jgi:hypothetical protein